MPEFALHPRLAADTVFLADWSLSRVLLVNNSRYPWLVLVPRRADASELHDLSAGDRGVLVEEVARASAGLKHDTGVTKINVGALGNIVSQLHVHVVARRVGDAAWPGPVWGHGVALAYGSHEIGVRMAELLRILGGPLA